MTNPEATARILADLRPVRRLASPWKRGLVVCAVGALVAVGVAVAFGVRRDAPTLGPILLWGLSAVQAAYGLVVIGAALRESVPGRSLPRFPAILCVAGAFALVLVVTMLTWAAHATLVPAEHAAAYRRVCLEYPVFIGLPVLVLTIYLVFRAYPTRPAVAGALSGLGAGLLADGSWRTFCEVTDPAHVLTSHTGSVIVLAAAGMAIGALVARVRSRRRA